MSLVLISKFSNPSNQGELLELGVAELYKVDPPRNGGKADYSVSLPFQAEVLWSQEVRIVEVEK